MATHSSILSWENPMDRSLVGYRRQCHRRVRRDSTATTTIFHCVYLSHLLSPYISWWTYRLLPCLGYCEKCCNVHWGTCTFFNLNKVFPRYMTKGLLLCILYMGLLDCHAAWEKGITQFLNESYASGWIWVGPWVAQASPPVEWQNYPCYLQGYIGILNERVHVA